MTVSRETRKEDVEFRIGRCDYYHLWTEGTKHHLGHFGQHWGIEVLNPGESVRNGTSSSPDFHIHSQEKLGTSSSPGSCIHPGQESLGTSSLAVTYTSMQATISKSTSLSSAAAIEPDERRQATQSEGSDTAEILYARAPCRLPRPNHSALTARVCVYLALGGW